jgi:hypothetical protein
MYHMNLVDAEFFLNCTFCITSLMVWCEWISLDLPVVLYHCEQLLYPFVLAVSVMAENGPLRFHAVLSGPVGPYFYRCKSI